MNGLAVLCLQAMLLRSVGCGNVVPVTWGHEVAKLAEALRFKPEGRGFVSRWCHWNFSLTYSFRPHYGPGIDSDSKRNVYQEYFLGVKEAGA